MMVLRDHPDVDGESARKVLAEASCKIMKMLTTKIEFLAITKGVSSDKLDAGARSHMGAAQDVMGVTKTHDGAVVSVNGNVEQPADATCMPVTGSGSGGRVGAPVCAPLTLALPRPTGIAVETPMQQVLALHVSGQATCQSTPAQQGVAGRVTALTPALARAVAATPKGKRASTSGWTGVMFNTETGNYYVRIITKGKQQTRLGSYDDKDEAAYAYAAGAVVLRPNQQINSSIELTAEEREALAGCTKDHLKLLVRHRRWNR
ncbi:unnamed protein product [Closterium sp. NIES-64]|nr:unnamed protein product [Closterium sp. NIES-64]